jgi:diacylglycerol kinase (ATP)
VGSEGWAAHPDRTESEEQSTVDGAVFAKGTVIVNPSACGRRALSNRRALLNRLHGCIGIVELAETQQQGDGTRLCREAVENGSEVIIAVGGDGTVNEVVNGLFGSRRSPREDPILGIIPTGTTCSLARELGIPRGGRSVDVIAARSVRSMDLAAVRWTNPEGSRQERLATTIVNFGFGGSVARRVGRHVKRLGGFPAFGLVATRQLFLYKGRHTTVWVEGRELESSRAFCVIVANTRSEGGGMRVAPQASPFDGLLDIVFVRELPLLSRLRHFPKVYRGKHTHLRAVKCDRARKVRVESPTLLPFEFDGEYAECLECEIEVIPRKLKVLVPEKVL